MKRALVLIDWNWLHETGQLSESDPLLHRVREAAPRMGMGEEALAKALERAGITNPVGPGLNWRKDRDLEGKCAVCVHARVTVQRSEQEVRGAAKRLARWPDSARARKNLDARQGELARAQAQEEWHASEEHTERAA